MDSVKAMSVVDLVRDNDEPHIPSRTVVFILGSAGPQMVRG